jgi:hypothetical protein
VRMMVGESDGFVIQDWRQFFTGHKGDTEATYTVNKGTADDAVDKTREGYARAFKPFRPREQATNLQHARQLFDNLRMISNDL